MLTIHLKTLLMQQTDSHHTDRMQADIDFNRIKKGK